jgi:hypothetical protein
MTDMNKHTISSDLRRALTGRGFFCGVAGMVLVIALSSLQNIIEAVRSGSVNYGFHAQLISTALSSDWVTLALPILCTLPFTAAFVDDMKSGFIKQYLHRAGHREYIRGKLFACGLSGGLVLFLGIIVAYGLSALIFTPMELALKEGQTAQPYFAQMLMTAATLFLSGAFWSLVGLTFAALTMSRYMAYASPFIFYYVLIILHERYFTSLYVLYPKEWLFPSGVWPMGGFSVLLMLAVWTAAVSVAFAIAAERGLRDV